MSHKRTRRKTFDPDYVDFRPAMYWLRTHGMSRGEIAEMFTTTENFASVSISNEKHAAESREASVVIPQRPNLALAEDEFVIRLGESHADELEEKIESLGESFWEHVRGLDGLLRLGETLREVSRPHAENIPRWRMRARLKHLMAETYLHAGYAKSAIDLCEEAFALELNLYEQTQSREDIKSYAKTLMLSSLARIMREEWESARKTLEIAEESFKAANVPIDPEIFRQRASISLRHGDLEEAIRMYGEAFESFPEHREYLGYGQENYARYDVGVRPLAAIQGDLEAAEHNLEVANDWPEGDIHRAINLNWAVAAAFRTHSPEAEQRAHELLTQAYVAGFGFGHQMTITRLLELTPRVRQDIRDEWVLFALRYNAYRKK